MEAYNPEHMSEPESWLELDEQERILLIETYHRVARIKLPNVTAHAALHAIGSVVAEHLFDILKTSQNDDAAASARYYAAVERLTAASWCRGEH